MLDVSRGAAGLITLTVSREAAGFNNANFQEEWQI
jgi:hypothetical protein